MGATQELRSAAIASVRTLLGFFALVVLVVEAAIGVLAATSEKADRAPLIFGMIGVLALVILIVALLAFFRKDIFDKRLTHSYSIVLSPDVDLAGFDIGGISWDAGRCFLNYAGKKALVRPVRGPVAGTEIRIPSEVLTQLSDVEPIDIELIDRKGLKWEVPPFFVYQRSVRMVCTSDRIEIFRAYGIGNV